MFGLVPVVLIGLAVVSEPGPTSGARSVLVLELRASGVDQATARILTEGVSGALAQRANLKVVTPKDIQSVVEVEKTRQLLGCQDDLACIAQLTAASDTDLVVSGSVGLVGRSNVLSLVLIDAKRAEPISRASESGTLQELSVRAGEVASRLFGAKEEGKRPAFRLNQGQKMSFAVLDLEPAGVDPAAAKNLTQVLGVEIKRVEGATVISRDDLEAIIQKDKLDQLLGKDCDTACVAEIGGALGVDRLVVGTVGKLNGTYTIALRLIDPLRVVVDNRVTEAFQGPEEQLLRAVRQAARQLLGVLDPGAGSIAVSSPQTEAEVWVDSKLLGVLPMPPTDNFTSGRHAIRVSREGFLDWHSEIYVDPNETSAVYADLVEAPQAWYEHWWVWAIAGTVVVGAGTAAILATQSSPETGRGVVTIPLSVP